ncbi:hypothetical protein R50345_22745 [Paenibacillus sp. FSL R5-0345]|uniref:hypothetical protein n=1 Tax=Paenibacillus sp. FSL R5-0345 TaxID=1536770 RepID=UPI0004F611EF|nr:hypothetical protein [Paenibacillus sp. FSL R5-0345]AIQ37206.1 hypothetical protein R50345_22745 [Paenibacillus sp. FSL R5-0345]
MSLTSLLTFDNNIKALFATIPNMKVHFQNVDGGDPFPTNPTQIVPREYSTAGLIGHGYDYLLRAYVQRINGVHQEQTAEELTAFAGLERWSTSDAHLNSRLTSIVEHRNRYISGQMEMDDVLLQDSLILAHLESYYRSGYMDVRGPMSVVDADIVDLRGLITNTQERQSFFIAGQGIMCNPSFGRAITGLVGGADGDLILDNTLIEIKVESSFKYAVRHLRQLIGYWILSCLTPDFVPQINRLGIWNPRYCRMVYITVEDICRAMDVRAFTEQFIDVLSQSSVGMGNIGTAMKRQRIEEIRALWNSPDQPIRQFY